MVRFKQNNIAIVGAGPSGVYCALNILKEFKERKFNSFTVTLFDKSEPLKTLLKTGGGRCNITNSISDIKDFASNYPRGEKFLYSLFSRHSNIDTINYFSSIGIKTYTQSDNRVFPVSNSAKYVRNKMLDELFKSKNIKIVKKRINSIKDIQNFDAIVVSNGSKDSENLIKSTGQKYIPFKKALCSLIINDFDCPMGVSVKSLDGEFIFTKNAISGPLAFKISSINAFKSFPYDIKINLFESEKLLDLAKKYPKKSIGNLVSSFIPRALAKRTVKNFDINAAEASKNILKSYSFLTLNVKAASPSGEIVNAGGIDLCAVDKNCKSKTTDNLWFCGEILNIDGFCGGFNLQNCWSSAYVVAIDVVSFIIKKNNGVV